MCGILGVVHLTGHEPIDVEQLTKANDTMTHRGPDEGGIWTGTGVGLAVRRLKVIDLEHGRQPMSNEDDSAHIVYNGEVYNHGDLRAELASFGHRFRSSCDTEVILHAYEQWGPEGCVSRLRGMFAFAIWDARDKRLFLARDRMGIKPLYVAEWNGRLFFASEIRPLLTCSLMERQIDLHALGAFLEIGFVTNSQTMFKGVRKIPPAHYLIAEAGRTSLHKYWELSYERRHGTSEREAVERFRELLDECVRIAMVSEVPLGALLSGGIDSTANVALMQRRSSSPITTVCVGFDTAGFDESALASRSARILGTEHHGITFSGDSMEDYPKALYFREEPQADSTFLAMYKLFQACRQEGLTVVLTGEGSDELLGGYYWHRGDAMLRPLLFLPHAVRVILASTSLVRSRGELGMRVGRILQRSSPLLPERYRDWIAADAAGLSDTLLSSDITSALEKEKVPSFLESWAELTSAVSDHSPLHQMLWLQSRTRMVDWTNHAVDRMSMAHSVEARPTFLDHILWEFCAALPPHFKLRCRWKPIEKYLLREATKGLVPEDVRMRRKKGLFVPYSAWLLRPRLPDWAEAVLSKKEMDQAGIFNHAAVDRLRRDHQHGAPGRATLLMGVISFQLWRKMFIESHPEGSLY